MVSTASAPRELADDALVARVSGDELLGRRHLEVREVESRRHRAAAEREGRAGGETRGLPPPGGDDVRRPHIALSGRPPSGRLRRRVGLGRIDAEPAPARGLARAIVG